MTDDEPTVLLLRFRHLQAEAWDKAIEAAEKMVDDMHESRTLNSDKLRRGTEITTAIRAIPNPYRSKT